MNRKNDNDITIFRHDIIVNFFDVALFLLLSLIIGDNFLSKGIDQKSRYPKYPRLGFAQYLQTTAFTAIELLRYTNREGLNYSPTHRLELSSNNRVSFFQKGKYGYFRNPSTKVKIFYIFLLYIFSSNKTHKPSVESTNRTNHKQNEK